MKPLKKKPTTHQSNTSSSVSNTLNVNVLPNELTLIASKDIDFVKDYLKKEQDHRHEMDKNILALEKSEQNIRENEVPFMRKFTFRGQIFSFLIILFCLALAAFSVYNGKSIEAIGSIIVAIIAVLPQLTKKKAK